MSECRAFLSLTARAYWIFGGRSFDVHIFKINKSGYRVD
jgi:hypothetical protein